MKGFLLKFNISIRTAEISQSRDGAHVFCKGNIVESMGKRRAMLRCTCNKRFFAVTGDHID
jgi:primase-polymerase (primpol)-like protein